MTLSPNVTAPGSYVTTEEALAPGALLEIPRNVALVGYRLSTASDANDFLPVRLRNSAEAATAYGLGSAMHLMALRAFEHGSLASAAGLSLPNVYAVATPPPTGTAHVFNIDFDGAATANGTVVLQCNEETLIVQVFDTETAEDVAARALAMYAGIDGRLSHAGTVDGVDASILHFTARWAGEVADFVIEADTSQSPGITVTLPAATAGAGVEDLTPALDAIVAEPYQQVVVCQDDAQTVADVLDHIATSWDATTGSWQNITMAARGTLGTAQGVSASLDNWHIQVGWLPDPAGGLPSLGTRYQAAAELGARMLTDAQANAYRSLRPMLTGGSRVKLDTTTLTDALGRPGSGVGGLCTFDKASGAQYGSELNKAASTATTDQTGLSASPDLRWMPFEVTRVAQVVNVSLEQTVDRFIKGDPANALATPENTKLLRASGILTMDTNQDASLITYDESRFIVSFAGSRWQIQAPWSPVKVADVVDITSRVEVGS